MSSIIEEMYQSVLKFLTPLNTDETYAMIVQEASKLMQAENGTIYLAKDDFLQITFSTASPSFRVTPRKRGFAYQAYITGKPIILDQNKMYKAHPADTERMKAIHSVIIIPLKNQDISIGVLAIQSKKRNYFDSKRMKILQLFGSMASLAIRKNQLYDELKKALEARDLFIAMAAHELKTPLTTISGYAQMLNLNKNELSHPEWTVELNREVKRLSRLINELLRVEQIKKGQLSYSFKECKISEIIKRAIEDFKYNNPNTRIRFINAINKSNDIIIGDFDKLLQVIVNLLNNAKKYSPIMAPISIYLEKIDSYFKIKIQDQGKGIEKKDIPYIFNKYYRSRDNLNKEGMGLGLFMVKEIISHHHGIIDVISQKTKGTIVEIKFQSINQ